MRRLFHTSFRREARWLLLIGVLLPALAMFAAVVLPAILRAWSHR